MKFIEQFYSQKQLFYSFPEQQAPAYIYTITNLLTLNERLLQFIWQYQYISNASLATMEDELINVIHPGNFNDNQGPDFLNARIKIGNTIWVGHIELHLKTSDWKKHEHETDPNYKNVILHVVWEHDGYVNNIPVLEMVDKVSSMLIHKYEKFSHKNYFIPCESLIRKVDEPIISGWKNHLASSRLKRKAGLIHNLFQESGGDWEKVCWWLIARNFGSHINSASFEQIARSLPLKLLTKHRNQSQQIESLLMGQGGFLTSNFNDNYPRELKREYEFLKTIYRLQPVNEKPKFLRMRPASFPTIRLSQLANLLSHSTRIFSLIRDASSPNAVRKLFDLKTNDYWNDHYCFDVLSSYKIKKPGPDLINNLFVNTICPLLLAYGDYHQEAMLKNRAFEWLQILDVENNSTIKGFMKLGLEIKSAFDTQAMIELKTQYCDQKRCLDCAIGVSLLNR